MKTMFNIVKWIGIILFLGFSMAHIVGFVEVIAACLQSSNFQFLRLYATGMGLYCLAAAVLIGVVCVIRAIIKRR